MAITFVNSVTDGSTAGNGFTTGSMDTSGASLLVLVAASFHGASTHGTPSDSKSNAWTESLNAFVTADTRCVIWYVENPTVGSGHTFTWTNGITPPEALGYAAIVAAAFAGTVTSGVADGATSNASTNTTIQPGSLTPSQNGDVIVAGLGFGATNTPSVDSGFSTPTGIGFSSGNHYGVSLAYLIQGTASAVNPTWTVGTSCALATVAHAFKADVTGRRFLLVR